MTTYTVEVEREVPLAARAVSSTVDKVLADSRGWTATGSHQLQRTAGVSDVRVIIATPETTDELCAPLDTGGRLSCRNGDLGVLNAWRWVNGAPAYRDDLVNYRRYLISHEFGHALGNPPHEGCPAAGELAPVMMRQTKGSAIVSPQVHVSQWSEAAPGAPYFNFDRGGKLSGLHAHQPGAAMSATTVASTVRPRA